MSNEDSQRTSYFFMGVGVGGVVSMAITASFQVNTNMSAFKIGFALAAVGVVMALAARGVEIHG